MPRRTPGQHPNSVQAPPQRVAGCLYDAHSNSVAFALDGVCVRVCRVPGDGGLFPICRADPSAAPLDDDDEDEERKEAETRGVRLNAGAQSFSRDPEGLAASLLSARKRRGKVAVKGPAPQGRAAAAVSSRAVRDAGDVSQRGRQSASDGRGDARGRVPLR